MLTRIIMLGWLAFFLSRVAAGPGVVPGDVQLTRLAQQVSLPGLDALVAATNWLGQGSLKIVIITLLIVVPMFLARFRAEALLVLVAALCRMLNSLIKVWLDSPRPTGDLVRVTEQATGFGYPSGHAMARPSSLAHW